MKKFFVLAATALFIMTSCSSDDAQPTNPDTNTALLKKTVETYEDGSTHISNYNYNGNKLTSIIESDGSKILFTYDGELMTEIKYYDNETLFQTNVLAYDTNNKLITHTMYSHLANASQRWEYTYNTDGTITADNFSGDLNSQTNQLNPYIVTLLNNNITEVNMDGVIETYTYTNTIDPHSLVTGNNGWSLAFFEGGTNNISTYLYTNSAGDVLENHTYTYTYNNANLPITSVETDVVTGEIITTQYFYE